MRINTYDKRWLVAGIAFLLLLIVAAILHYDKNDGKKPLGNNIFTRPSVPAQNKDVSYPAQVLNLSEWKLTLPIADPVNPSQPLEIIQPELATYLLSPWFTLTPDKKGVAFRAPVNAPTTANSDYPRSELREADGDVTQSTYWSTTNGAHALFLEEAITAVPKNKPHVVAGQIHGDDDDLLVIRLEYPKLYVTRSKKNVYTLDNNYTLGKRFSVRFVANDGHIYVYYNGGTSPVYVLDKKVKLAYFKVGAYTQSNCETEDSPSLCNSSNYGEVVVYQALVTHQ